jgi:hypothetical protein
MVELFELPQEIWDIIKKMTYQFEFQDHRQKMNQTIFEIPRHIYSLCCFNNIGANLYSFSDIPCEHERLILRTIPTIRYKPIKDAIEYIENKVQNKNIFSL